MLKQVHDSLAAADRGAETAPTAFGFNLLSGLQSNNLARNQCDTRCSEQRNFSQAPFPIVNQ